MVVCVVDVGEKCGEMNCIINRFVIFGFLGNIGIFCSFVSFCGICSS